MLHIILLILKIIGIVVLVLLLTVILLVLLVPIRYRIRGSYHGKPQGLAKITWLLHIVSVTASYEEDFVLTARIFGYPIVKPVVKDEEEVEDFVVQAMEATDEDSQKAAETILGDVEASGEKALGENPAKGNGAARKNEAAARREKSAKTKETVGDERAGETDQAGENGLFSRFQSILSKLKFSFTVICDKLKNILNTISEKKDGIQEWVTDEENQKTIRLLFRQAKKFLRHILPVKGKGNVVFGFEDPYLTGQTLTYLSVVYPLCHRHLEFWPVFDCDGPVLEADGNFRGRVRLGTLLVIAVRVLLNKNFRVILKRWLR